MTIVIGDMICEMAKVQKQILKEHGLMVVNFKGFIANSTQVNFNAIWNFFGLGNKNTPMSNKKRICQFH